MATRKKKASASKKTTEKMVTRVALVIDRSGSMGSIRQQALDGINEQLNGLRASAGVAGETYVTLIDFDNEIKVHFNQREASKLTNLEPADFVPRGSTALYDATMTAISRLQEEKETCENTAYLVVVITDGGENASRTSKHTLASRIKELQGTGKWTFTYMLSNVDLSVATDLNVPASNVGTWYSSTAAGASAGFAYTSNSIGNYVNTRGLTGTLSVSNFYSPNTDVNKVVNAVTDDDSVKITNTNKK
jgi:uncharacterized protein YegL